MGGRGEMVKERERVVGRSRWGRSEDGVRMCERERDELKLREE